jgi:hypothetical protein
VPTSAFWRAGNCASISESHCANMSEFTLLAEICLVQVVEEERMYRRWRSSNQLAAAGTSTWRHGCSSIAASPCPIFS